MPPLPPKKKPLTLPMKNLGKSNKSMFCKACVGTGVSSKNSVCYPCSGTGFQRKIE